MSIVKKRFRDPDSGGKMYILQANNSLPHRFCLGIAYVKGRDVLGNAYNRPREGTKHSVEM